MANDIDDTVVHIAENSPEQVAYKLLDDIAFAEGKSLRPEMTGQKADRAYILTTYWECLKVVQGVGIDDNIHSKPTRVPHSSLSAGRPRTILRKLGVTIGLLNCVLFGD